MSTIKKNATELFEAFHEEESEGGRNIDIPNPPPVVWQLGEVLSISYMARLKGKMVSFEHEFRPGSGPLLTVSPDGKNLFLAAGKYKVTERGIIDI
jgi:hypothetical protein